MRSLFLILFLSVNITFAFSQDETIRLWEDVEQMKREKSRLHIFHPNENVKNNIPVIVCPGGSYAHLYALKSEGFDVAQWLNENGFAAFVLEYRVGSKGYNHPAMIEDVQKAIRWVRTHAEKYDVDADQIGVMGFSAGGHLSLMAGTFYDENYLEKFGIENNVSLKPAFIVPVYPVVSMQDSIAHLRSRKNLLGKKGKNNVERKEKFSIELQVHKDMPPVFLVTTKDDPVVDCRNSTVLHSALNTVGVNNKFFLYEKGGHGFGINEKKAEEAARWKYLFKEWIDEVL